MSDIGFQNVPANESIPGVYPEVQGDIPGQATQTTLIIGQVTTGAPAVPFKCSSVAYATKQCGPGSQLASAFERYYAADPDGNIWLLPLADNPGQTYSVGLTNGSAAITGLPAGLANGMAIVGLGIPAGGVLASYSSGAGTANISSGNFTGSTGTETVHINGAIAASGIIDFTHTPNEDGVVWIYIAGRAVPVPVTNNQSPNDIATATYTAINAYSDSNDLGLKKRQRNFLGCKMPVTASLDEAHPSRVILTANNGGTVGNGIDIRLNYYGTSGQQVLPKGLTVAITAMSGGAIDPDTSGLDAILVNTPYDFIVQPYSTTQALNDFQTLMLDSTGRWKPSRKVFGHVFGAAQFPTNGTAAITFGLARNDRHMTIYAFEASMPHPNYDVAGAAAGAYARACRSDPARPSQTLALPDILSPEKHNVFAESTRNTLLQTGLALLAYNEDRTVEILRSVTTYQTDANGSPDISYRDTETNYTIMAVVRQIVADWGTAFPRAKIIDDGVAFGSGGSFNAGLPNQPIVTPKSGSAVIVASYARMANGKARPILVTGVPYFSKNLVLQRNSQDPTRMDALLPIILASGLRVTAMLVDFALQTPTS